MTKIATNVHPDFPKPHGAARKRHKQGSKCTFLEDLDYTRFRMVSLASLPSFTQKNYKNV